jgi:LmbE family N-acetylglucosaminyl deacetylase
MAVHQRIIAEPSFVVDVSEVLSAKIEALRAYDSQFTANESNAGIVPMMEAAAHMWGSLANVRAGEPFFALEPIAITSPTLIL